MKIFRAISIGIKKKVIYLLVLLLIAKLFLQLWMFLFFLIPILYFYVSTYLIKKFKNRIIKKGLFILQKLSLFFALIVCVKMFAFEVYFIPSKSMLNTLYPNDFILVSKLDYGPLLPTALSEIPILRLFASISKDIAVRKDINFSQNQRLSGLSYFKRGDIVIFKNDNISLAKRCIAISGDTLKIENGEIFINSHLKKFFKNTVNTYSFKLINRKVFYNKLDSLNINALFQNNKLPNWKIANFSRFEAEQLKKTSSIDSISILIDTVPIKAKLFPWYKLKGWTLDNYGSIIIPKKGMQIVLNNDSYRLYKNVLIDYENVSIRKKGNQFIINGETKEKYTFRKNYYFMMGDNRKNSKDSRYIGLIPEDYIIGRVICVLISLNQNEFQWERLFKVVR